MGQIFTAIAKTPTSELEYTVSICQVESDLVSELVDKSKFDNLCLTGCQNYNRKWACPPSAPSFVDFSYGKEHTYVVFMQLLLNQFEYIKNGYLKVKAGNSILKSRADKLVRSIAENHGRYISSGSCHLCKPCKGKLEQPCRYPEKMTYSFEALGVDVELLINKCFQSTLLWYKNGTLPEYTSVVCGLLTNEIIEFKAFEEIYISLANFAEREDKQ